MAQAFISNQGTQTNLLVDTTGGTTSSGTSIPVMKLSIDAGGTYTNPWNGSITGVGTLPGIGVVSNITNGSINIPNGTLQALGTLGTVSGLGTLPGVGVVTSLTNGSVNIPNGTLQAIGTLGTVGTVQGLGTLPGVGVVTALTNGSVNVPSGTIQALGTMGTLGTLLNLGSVTNIGQVYNAGTLQAGTIQLNPLTATNTISHAGTSGTTGIGTLVGTASIGAGTALYPTHISILVLSGTPEVCLAFGSQINGPQVIRHGLFPAGGGVDVDIHYPHGYGTTNSPLTYQIISGAGTVAWDVNYFTHT